MKSKLLIFIVAVLGTVGGTSVIAQYTSDSIIAIVNSEVITYGEVYKEIKESIIKIEQTPGIPAIKKAEEKKKIFQLGLQKLVDRKLTLQETKKYNIKVSEETIKEQMQRELKQYKGKPIGVSDFDLSEIIRQRLTLRQLFQKKSGYSREEKRRARIDPYVSPAEIRRYYQKHIEYYTVKTKIKIRVITLKYATEERGREKTMDIAGGLVRELREKADFGLTAKDNSEDIYADYGGTWPRVDRILFDISKDNSDWIGEKDLDQSLRKKFSDKKIQLSEKLLIEEEEPDEEWSITDLESKKEYRIKKKDDMLRISQKNVWVYITRGTLTDKDLENTAFSLSKGDISDPIPVGPDHNGYCRIVKVEDVKLGGTKQFVEVQEDIRQLLRYKKIVAAFERMAVQLRREVFIWTPEEIDLFNQ